jgi:hypothetical protein
MLAQRLGQLKKEIFSVAYTVDVCDLTADKATAA